MTLAEVELKQEVLINYLKGVLNDNTFKIKAEYSTNDNDTKVIVVQEQAGEKVVFYGDVNPLYNYYEVVIFGSSIREEKNISILFGELIGENAIYNYKGDKWQILVKQLSNPQTIEYQDIRRVGYSMIFQTVINKISEEE
jgi:hypothetical protein